MDPDATLRKILEIAGNLHDADTDGMAPEELRDTAEQGCMLAEYVKNLDDWVLKGGFLPERWGGPETRRPVRGPLAFWGAQ